MKRVTSSVLFLVLTLCGCSTIPDPAETEVIPGKAEVSSETREQRPRESKMSLKIEPPQPPEGPTVRIIIQPLKENSLEEQK